MEKHPALSTFRALPIAMVLDDDLKSNFIGLFRSSVRLDGCTYVSLLTGNRI